MRTMIRSLTLMVLTVALVWCQTGFAADVPAIATKDDDLSKIALAKAKEVFPAQKEALLQQIETDGTLAEDQKVFIEALLVKAEQQLQSLDSMEVYFVDENSPGEAYDSVVDFYQGKLNHFESVESSDLIAMLAFPEMMSEATRTALEQMISDGSARAIAGTSGSTRISVMTFYVHPETLELIQKTTIIVATAK